MLKISGRDKMTNEEVLKRVGETRSIAGNNTPAEV